MCFAISACAQPPTDTRKSGYTYMAPATQALQNDDSQNPAMLWVKDGEAAWQRTEGIAGKSCATCHGDAKKSMRGVAARFPAYSTAIGRVRNLQQQINLCRTSHQKTPSLSIEHQTLIALESFIALQSRGMPIKPPVEPKLADAQKKGEALFNQRIGQIDLSCHDCHNNQPGRSLAGNLIPQAHPTGYPLYRLEWQGVGGLQRRLRNCMVGVRAEPYAFGSDEMVALEAYLAVRAAGMKLEAPAVRP
ncbi:MAG: sulfur oxidation c-type cytochrome SoxA [Aeromicrobium sp.]|nr:sulfur oxidation c-type cytochrome SoxA [Burkholderiales bacterium]